MKFEKLFAGALAVALCLFWAQPQAAHADNVQTIIGLTYKSGLNSGKSLGNLVITHPNFVFCTGSVGSSSACSFQVSVRAESNLALPLTMEVINGSGDVLTTFTAFSSGAVISLNVGPRTNQPVYYNVAASNSTIAGSRDYVQPTNLQVTGTEPKFTISDGLGENTDNFTNRNFTVNSKLIFAQAKIPSQMSSNTVCLTVPVLFAPIDYISGSPASAAMRRDIDIEVWTVNGGNVNSASKQLTDAKGTWNSSSTATKVEVETCGLDPSKGIRNYISLFVRAVLRFQGTTYTSNSSDQIIVTGTAPLRQIACAKGNKAIIVTAAFPKCPSGFKNSSIPIINGKLRKTTIICVKGLTVRKVTAEIPSCPAGYRRK